LTDKNAKIHFKNGMVYEGQIVNGILNGKGKLKLTNGIVYKGNMVDNKIDNHGRLEYSK
jgi:hypothetical protein